MSNEENLEKLFGKGFVKKYKTRVQKKRAEKEKISEDDFRAIIALVNEGKFDPDDPHFEYEKHHVLLVETPEKEMEVRELDSGAVSVPMLYQGDWLSALFNDPKLSEVVVSGDFYVVIGDYWEKEGDQKGTKFLNMRVKAVVPIGELEKMKEKPGVDADVSNWFSS